MAVHHETRCDWSFGKGWQQYIILSNEEAAKLGRMIFGLTVEWGYEYGEGGLQGDESSPLSE